MREYSRRPKLLFILPLPPPIHGASLRNKALLASKRLNHNYHIRTIAMQFIKENAEMGQFSIGKVLKAISLYLRFIIISMSYRPNLIYFNSATIGFALYRDLVVIFLAKLLCKRVIVHLRTQGIKSQVEKSQIKKWLISKVFKNTIIVCLSELLSKDVSTVYDRKPKIVNNGLEYIASSIRKNKSGKVTFLLLSIFLKTKGIPILIKACKLLVEKGYNFEVIIAGKDAELSAVEIKTLVQDEQLQDTVKVVGPVYDKAKIKIFEDSDIFILPTTWEAFPGVIIEAMQFQMPIISTYEGAIPEIVDEGKTGILVQKNDIKKLSNAMAFFLDYPDKILEFGTQAKEEYLKRFTFEIFESNMDRLFRESL